MTEQSTKMETAVSDFQTKLKENAENSAALRAEWIAIEKAASEARRAYLGMAMGDDNFARGATIIRKVAPIALKFIGTGGIGVGLTSFLANSDSTGGIIGPLKSLLGLG